MAVQDQEQSMELQVDIAMEYQGEDPLVSPPPIEVIQEEPRSKDDVEYMLQLEEKLDRTRAKIEEQTNHIEDLRIQLVAKDELINSLLATW
jgi:hypothetical protein